MAFLSMFFAFSLNAFSQNSIFGKIEEYNKSETAKKAYRKLDSDDVTGALKILDKAIEKKEDLFEAYRTRAFIRQYYNNDIDGAISDVSSALEIKPDDVDSYISRASLKKRYKNDFNGALLDYQTAQRYKPDSTVLLRLKASLKANLKDFNGAIAEIESALKIIPEDIELHTDLSNLLLQKNETDKAIVYLQTFLDDYLKKANGKLPKIKGEKIKKNKIASEFKDSAIAKNGMPVKRYSQMEFNVNSAEDLQKQQAAIDEARNYQNPIFNLENCISLKIILTKVLSV